MYTPPTIRNILVPTDFSSGSDGAFAHALRLALALKANLDVLHLEPKNDRADWRWAPHVVETLARWHFVAPRAGQSDVEALGIHARQTLATGQAADVAILREIAESHADLLVLATHGRAGLQRLLQPSVTEAVMRLRPVPILLLPAGCPGFVDPATGESTLDRVLIPIAATPNPAPAFDLATAVLRALGGQDAQIATLHVGQGHPEVELLRPDAGWKVFHWNASGSVEAGILDVAQTWSASRRVPARARGALGSAARVAALRSRWRRGRDGHASARGRASWTYCSPEREPKNARTSASRLIRSARPRSSSLRQNDASNNR